MGVRLPAEYQEVEYLKSITGAYIDTGYKPNSDTVVIAKYRSTIYNYAPFAVRWSGAPTYNTFGVYTARAHDSIVYYGDYADQKYINPNMTLVDHHMTIGIDSVLIDGVSYAISRDIFTQNYNLYLFAMNNLGTATLVGNAVIYTFQLKEQSEIVADFVPCYRKSDSEPGMYDLVSGTFFTNAGTGEFVVGNDVIDSISPWLVARRRLLMQKKPARLPAEYQEVEYLESTGVAQWIDVGFPITDALSMELTFSAITDTASKYYMGLYSNNQGDFYLYNSSGKFQIAYGCGYATTSVNVDTDKHTFVFSFDSGNAVVRENGIVIVSEPKFTPLKTDRHIRIAGAFTGGQNKSRTYAFIAYSGANNVANFVPCYRKADDKPGMYDLVSNTFFTNAGTGEFIVGADIN